MGTVRFDEATVTCYLEAVADEAMSRLNASAERRWVPPLAVAAQFSAVVSQLELPLEALHTAQEVDLLAPLPVGSEVACRGRVAARRESSHVAFLHLEFEGRDATGTVVVRGKSTILLPKEEVS